MAMTLAAGVLLSGCEQKCEQCTSEGEHHVQLSLKGANVTTKALDVPSLSESNVVLRVGDSLLIQPFSG